MIEVSHIYSRFVGMMLIGARYCNRHKRLVFCTSLFFCILMIFIYKAMNSNYVQRDEMTYLNRIESVERIGLAAAKTLSLPLVFGAALEHYGFPARVGIAGLNFLATVLSAAFIFLIVQKWLDSFGLGILAMLAVGVFYQSVEFSLTVLREPVYFLCVCMVFWACIDGVSSPNCGWHAFFCGLFCILGFWTRFEGVELLICYPLAVFVGFFSENFRCGIASKKILCFLIGILSSGLLLAYCLPQYYSFVFEKVSGYLAVVMK